MLIYEDRTLHLFNPLLSRNPKHSMTIEYLIRNTYLTGSSSTQDMETIKKQAEESER
jgi:hypothetical protein